MGLRADADDRSSPNRAERQLRYLLEHPNLTVLGAQLSECSLLKGITTSRRLPLMSQKIKHLLFWRNPINHPTVALHRQSVLSVGNYRAILSFEDWDLWLRLSCQGARFANLPDVLVTTDVDSSHLLRRYGFVYAKREFAFFLRCCTEGLIPAWRVLLLIILRLPLRLLPKTFLAGVMQSLRAQSVTSTDKKG